MFPSEDQSDQGTHLVNISVTSNKSEAAAKFANTVAEVYIDYMYKRKVILSNTGIDLLRDQLKEVQTNRMKAMNDLLKFKEEHGVYDLRLSYDSLVAQRNVLETKLFDAEMDMDELEMTLQEVKANRKNAVIMLPYLVPGGESGNLSSLQTMLLTHKMRLPELLTQYSAGHQAVKIHHTVTEMIESASESEVEISMNGLELKRQRAQKLKERLRKQIDEIESKLIELDKLGGDYRMRETACTKLDETITKITSRINELQIADATTIGNYSIYKVNDAKRASYPFFPQPKKVLALAGIGGLALAALISFILVSINNKVVDISQVTQVFGESVPVFGSLPLFVQDEQELLRSNGEEQVDEVFRDLRTSLNLSMITRNSKLVAVTSALPHEGKTFVVCNLARSFARDNKRTLLLELDLRKPRLHKLLKNFLPRMRRSVGSAMFWLAIASLRTWCTILTKESGRGANRTDSAESQRTAGFTLVWRVVSDCAISL
jgi:capsular polysaccharide biosynthesis protein